MADQLLIVAIAAYHLWGAKALDNVQACSPDMGSALPVMAVFTSELYPLLGAMVDIL